MNQWQTITEIKASIFDFHDLFSHEYEDFQVIVEHFNHRIRSILQAERAKLFVERQQLERIISPRVIYSLRSVISVDQAVIQTIDSLFDSLPDVFLQKNILLDVTGAEYPYHVILKLNTNIKFKCFYVLSYKEQTHFLDDILQELCYVIEKHIEVLTAHIQERFIQERNQLLYQLSTNLHSVHKTTDVLQRVYRYVKILYPKFKYRFLMSHEYENVSIPLYPIEYNDNENCLGTTAFINNDMQMEYDVENNRTIIYSPLSGRQGVYGVLEVTIPKAIRLNDSDYEFIKQSSKMIGRAVERTTLYQTSTQLITDLQFINIASRELNRNLERSEISENVKKHIVNSCHADDIAIVLLEKTELGEEVIITDESTDYFKTPNADSLVHYLSRRLKERPEPILSGNFKIKYLTIPFNSIMVIPMWDSERMFGFIVIAHENPYYFSFDKYKFMQSFVQHAALAYINSMLKEQLRKTAITDYLTKLYLRNYLDKKIDKHMKTDAGGSFMLLDIDDFKSVNDTYGHYVGDRVLIQIANIIKETLDENEIGARWGGEEFAIYLPYYNRKYATFIAENIKKKVKTRTNPNVTLSIGISFWSDENQSIEQLFIKADEALYEAKEFGKNRIIVK